MNSRTHCLLSLTALLASSTTSTAQAPISYDRRVAEVRLVHPPGTPPGSWRVEATLEFGADDSSPVGLDLSADVLLELNGTPILATPVSVQQLSAISCSLGMQCLSNIPCSYWYTNNQQLAGICGERTIILPNQTYIVCACWNQFNWVGPVYLYNPTDSIGVRFDDILFGMPELATADDGLTIPVGENHPGLAYCAGDGTLATACPCGNSGASGHGCASSANPNGALLEATGFTEIDPLTGTDAVVLHASGMPATATAIYLKGSSSLPNGVVFGDGVRCVAGTLIRMATKPSVGGSSQFPEAGDPSVSVRGGTPSGSGMTGSYQFYYRNPPDFCTPATFNVSNGVQILW